MMPRASHLIAEKKDKEFAQLIQKSYDFTLAIAFPVTLALILCAPTLIIIFCGKEFEQSIEASQIIAPIILFVAISNVMGLQILYPKGKINIVTLCCGIGAVADLMLNLYLIPTMSYIGTSIAYVGAEFATLFSMSIIGRKYIPLKYFRRKHLNYVLGSIFMAIAFYGIMIFDFSAFPKLILQGFCGLGIYLLVLYICKDEFLMQILLKVKTKF